LIKARKIELLAPAKNLEYGIEAINHGADAVYIGAPRFGARAAVGNTTEDIKELARYAHSFGARVYVALNTILRDEELPEAEKIIWELYEAGIDALIVQDMGLLMLDLPPIPLHASTQTDNRALEKVLFLEESGFSQVVLARELTVQEIENISTQTSVTLEAFIHGALCVSYSGQCYLSHAICGRSANRGECAQFCRLPYTLLDSDGKEIVRNKHLLSMKDLNLSDNLEELLSAGVGSLKIEGRLKDLSYVKNTVSYYRKRLDDIISKYPQYIRASSGKSKYTFEPDLNKSFNRGYTSYFFTGRKPDIWSVYSPKSIGEPIGKVKEVFDRFFVLTGTKKLNNGDGLCFINAKGEMQGVRVNRVDGERIYPAENHVLVRKGSFLYRNYDHEFEKILAKKSAERKINAVIAFRENTSGFLAEMEDEDGISVSVEIPYQKKIAQKTQNENIITNLSKTGNTIFNITDVEIHLNENWFIPSSVLSEIRRHLTEKLLEARINSHIIPYRKHQQTTHAFPEKNISYHVNVMNSKSELFYQQHKSIIQQPAFEKKKLKNVPLMFTRHCIKYAMGWCPKVSANKPAFKEPYFLSYNDTILRLVFDCKNCEMRIIQEK